MPNKNARSKRAVDAPLNSNFSDVLGIETPSCTDHESVCSMVVQEHMLNRNGVLHGGAVMTLSDTVAGTVCFVNAPPGKTNTTIDAKTNFIRPVSLGDTVTATCVPLHVGRSTAVLQITLTRGDGKTVAVTTQTHQFLDWKGKPPASEEQQ